MVLLNSFVFFAVAAFLSSAQEVTLVVPFSDSIETPGATVSIVGVGDGRTTYAVLPATDASNHQPPVTFAEGPSDFIIPGILGTSTHSDGAVHTVSAGVSCALLGDGQAGCSRGFALDASATTHGGTYSAPTFTFELQNPTAAPGGGSGSGDSGSPQQPGQNGGALGIRDTVGITSFIAIITAAIIAGW